LNPNFVKTNGLQNYWTFCSSLTDVITNLTLYNGENYAFTSNRYNKTKSALSLSSGYLQAPSSVYFTGGSYTVMAWVYPRQFTYNARLIDFGNGQASDNIVLCLSSVTTGKPYTVIIKGATNPLLLYSTQPLELNKWSHLAFTFSGSTRSANIYVNGILTAQGTSSNLPNNVVRTKNYIGKSNWGNPNVDAIFDELKIFSVDLTQSQIRFEMQNDYFFPGSSTTSLYFIFSKVHNKAIALFFALFFALFSHHNTLYQEIYFVYLPYYIVKREISLKTILDIIQTLEKLQFF
jgi:hypothetical protein